MLKLWRKRHYFTDPRQKYCCSLKVKHSGTQSFGLATPLVEWGIYFVVMPRVVGCTLSLVAHGDTALWLQQHPMKTYKSVVSGVAKPAGMESSFCQPFEHQFFLTLVVVFSTQKQRLF